MKVLEESPQWNMKIRCSGTTDFDGGCNSLLLIDKNDIRYVVPGRERVMGIDKRKITYRGKDGKDYFDKESLDVANRIYEETMNSKIYKDSKYYNNPDIPRDSIYYDDPDISHKTR